MQNTAALSMFLTQSKQPRQWMLQCGASRARNVDRCARCPGSPGDRGIDLDSAPSQSRSRPEDLEKSGTGMNSGIYNQEKKEIRIRNNKWNIMKPWTWHWILGNSMKFGSSLTQDLRLAHWHPRIFKQSKPVWNILCNYITYQGNPYHDMYRKRHCQLTNLTTIPDIFYKMSKCPSISHMILQEWLVETRQAASKYLAELSPALSPRQARPRPPSTGSNLPSS